MGFKHNARPAEWVLVLNPIATEAILLTYTYYYYYYTYYYYHY